MHPYAFHTWVGLKRGRLGTLGRPLAEDQWQQGYLMVHPTYKDSALRRGESAEGSVQLLVGVGDGLVDSGVWHHWLLACPLIKKTTFLLKVHALDVSGPNTYLALLCCIVLG